MAQLDIDVISQVKSRSFEYYLQQVKDLDGMIMEFGVATGATINDIAANTKKIVYGFDSFEGLPESGGQWSKGDFKCPVPKVSKNVELIIGWYDQVLEGFLKTHLDKVAFLHMDSDLYSSTKYVLTQLKDRIQNGTIIAFDEIVGYHGTHDFIWIDQEYKAFNEILAETGWNWECIGHHADKAAFVISNVK